MSVKIRLARHGKKNQAFFHIVVADSRAPRDGRFIEKIGTYNPNTNPAKIELDSDKAMSWLFKGAQPSDTCRRLLSYKGVLLRKHLQEGVNKGAISQETADQRLSAWVAERESAIIAKKNSISQSLRDSKKSVEEAEAKVNEARAAEINKKREEERAAIEAKKAAEAAEAAAETTTEAAEQTEVAEQAAEATEAL